MFILYSCDYEDQKLCIVNTTEDTIFFQVKLDTAFNIRNKPKYYQLGKESHFAWKGCLLPKETERSSVLNTKWENVIDNGFYKKVTIFIFKKALLDNVKWDYVVSNQYFTKKFKFTVEELEELDWKVVYSTDSIHLYNEFEKNK